MHTLVVLFHVYFFCFQHPCLDTLFTEVFNQCLVFRECLVTAEKSQESFFHLFLVIRSNQSLCFCQILGCQYFLCFHKTFHHRAESFEKLVFAFRYRTGNNQRCTGIIDQYRVYLIDDRIIVLTLYEVFRADGHVVTQIVETEFVVCTESDVCQISLTACIRVRLVSVDTVDAQSVEHVKRSHPFRVTFCQIVVHGYNVHTVSGQCVQEHRQGSH
ncbi:uncharacterized protein BN523_00125 [Bacteroides sp. CAG:189]|nr:uncharacterized protein BN523_00125 [Bacteroides sp. CAG:189]